jgi:hypothetical protein
MQHLRLGRRPARIRNAEELLGTTYSSSTLRELKGLTIGPLSTDRRVAIKWLITSQHARQRDRFATVCGAREGCRVEMLDFDSGWHDLTGLEEVLPDVGIAEALAAMVREES